MAFKLFGRNKGDQNAAAAKKSAPAHIGSGKQRLSLPFLTGKPVAKQLQILGLAFVIAASSATFAGFRANRNSKWADAQMSAVSELQNISQGFSKRMEASAALTDSESVTNLRAGQQRFTDVMNVLVNGGNMGGVMLPAAAEMERSEIDAVSQSWTDLDKVVKSYLLEYAVADTTGSLELVNFDKTRGEIKTKSAAIDSALNTLQTALEDSKTSHSLLAAISVVLGVLSIGLLALMVRVFSDESTARREEAERQRREAEASKEAAQQAILRLMNEMGDLADGDLTIRATVTEDITGAIADSVNYTVEELSVLVKRIDDAATRVNSSVSVATETSKQLLSATEVQWREIQNAGTEVLSMAQSMHDASEKARQSGEVARQSLDVAEKGAVAVQNSITGMNEIRDQIQDTSKRIKRLGESSQEIGEIVELISDITEQTNVLALNAAIQAASAGEAGRGFSVVAEEVQRLAERSAEATKQIAALVKTIQTDTNEAVAAMERSTQNVVEGAKLSDATGQALSEISDVSRNLAQLIGGFSGDTQTQAEVASQVAEKMREILRITELTTTGTQQTARSIGELSDLAVELKGSVAGFKV